MVRTRFVAGATTTIELLRGRAHGPRCHSGLVQGERDPVVLGRERRQSLSSYDGERARLGPGGSRPLDVEAGVIDPAGEVTQVDDESVDAEFVGIVEPRSFEESVDVYSLNPLVHVVVVGTEPEGVEEGVGAVLDPAEDQRVGPPYLTSVCAYFWTDPSAMTLSSQTTGGVRREGGASRRRWHPR